MKFVCVLLLPAASALGTGFEEPERWLDYGGKKPLQAPEFYFELELKRIAAGAPPGFKAMPPQAKEEEDELKYERQTGDTDISDFDAAIENGAIKPPDAEVAKTAHKGVRKLIDMVTPALPADADAAPDLPKLDLEEFPSEFADYHHGAWAYHHRRLKEAVEAWKALLARPAAEHHYRTTWAAYMLGCAARDEKRWDDARASFGLVRKAVADGFADSLGLASASLGWEAQSEQDAGNPDRAAQLFIEQLATGDMSAVWSLKSLVEEVVEKDPEIAKFAKEPSLQRVVTCFAIAGMGGFSTWEEAKEGDPPVLWLAALEKIGAKNVKDADRVAWLAYQTGRYDQAARWLKRADPAGPYVQWLQAKFALREGKTEVALKLISQALPALVKDSGLESRNAGYTEVMPGNSARGDIGAIQIARGDYLTALQVFLDGGHGQDISYLAEGVLTIPELKKFVEALPEDDPKDEERAQQHRNLRHILGSRLVRREKYTEARPYLREDDQQTLDEYTALLDRAAGKGAAKADKIAAFVEAAKLIREKGWGLYEVDDVNLQAARLTGREAEKNSYPQTTVKLGPKTQFAPDVTRDERERLKKNASQPFRHSLHIYVAADLLWRAAALMPDSSEETAKLLNRGGNWLKYKDDGAADRFLQAIERRCPKTETGAAVSKKHWFVDSDDE